MNQQDIRQFNNITYSTAEGDALIQELNSRTKSDIVQFNSIEQIAQYLNSTTNKWKVIDFGTVGVTGDGNPPDIAAAINNLPNTLDSNSLSYNDNRVGEFDVVVFTGVVFPADRSPVSYRQTIIAVGKPKGLYGQGGSVTVQNNDLFVIANEQLTSSSFPVVISSDPNARLIDLGEIADGDFVSEINGKITPFHTVGENENIYFQFTQSAKRVILAFVGSDGMYGQGQGQVVESDFLIVVDERVDVTELKKNTFIGGVASLFPTKTDFAAAITNAADNSAYSESDITNYEVVGDDIAMTISKPYRLNTQVMRISSPENELITSYEDVDGLCRHISGSVFQGCINLTKIDFKGLRTISSNVFLATGITHDIYLPELQSSGGGCFMNVPTNRITCPKLLVIPQLFMSGTCTVRSINDTDFPSCIEVVGTPFPNNIIAVRLPNVKVFGDSTFKGRSSFNFLSAPNLHTMGQQVFWNSGLSVVELPSLETVTNSLYTFGGIQSLKAPKLRYLGQPTDTDAWFIKTNSILFNCHKSLKFVNQGQPHQSIQSITGATVINYVGDADKDDLAFAGVNVRDVSGALLGNLSSNLQIDTSSLEWDDVNKTLRAKDIAKVENLSEYNDTVMTANIRSVQMNDQGTRVFWATATNCYTAKLSQPFNLSTINTITALGQKANCIRVSVDGTKAITILQNGSAGLNNYREWTLSSPYDLTTAALINSINIQASTSVGDPGQLSWYGFGINEQGTELFSTPFQGSTKILKLTLPNPFDLSSYIKTETATDVGSGIAAGASISFAKRGHIAYVGTFIGNVADRLFKYYLKNPYDFEGETEFLGPSRDVNKSINFGSPWFSNLYEDYMIYCSQGDNSTLRIAKINKLT